MQQLSKEFGKHYLVEFTGCVPDKIGRIEGVRPVFLKAAKLSRATLLEDCFHQFEPEGVSGIIFIAESHFSIHTWPQDGYAGVDILTCGEMYPDIAIEYIKKNFGADQVKIQIIPRGF